MPYETKQDGEDWLVIESDSEEEKSRHTPPDAKEKAERQVHLLNMLEHQAEHGGSDSDYRED